MSTIYQRVIIMRRKDGKSKGVFIKKDKGPIIIERDKAGNIVKIYRGEPGKYFNNSFDYEAIARSHASRLPKKQSTKHGRNEER